LSGHYGGKVTGSEDRPSRQRHEILADHGGWSLEFADWAAVGERLVLFDRRREPEIAYPLMVGIRPTRVELAIAITGKAPEAPAGELANGISVDLITEE
jgi:hypothetical protein